MERGRGRHQGGRGRWREPSFETSANGDEEARHCFTSGRGRHQTGAGHAPAANSQQANTHRHPDSNPDRRRFDKLMKDGNSVVSGPHAAASFVAAMASFEDKRELLCRLRDPAQHGERRLAEVLRHAPATAEALDGIVIAMLQHLTHDDVTRDPRCKEALDAVCLQVYKAPFLMPQLLSAAKQRQLPRSHVIVTFLLQLVLGSNGADARADPEVRQLSEELAAHGAPHAGKLRGIVSAGILPSGGAATAHDVKRMPGGRHDNDHMDFRSICLLPTSHEVRCSATPFLPQADGSDGFLNDAPEARALDCMFRLLREDMLAPVRQVMTGAASAPRTVKFPNARVVDVALKPQPVVVVRFEAPRAMKGKSIRQQADFWKSCKLLAVGSLVALCRPDGEHMFAEVVIRPGAQLPRPTQQPHDQQAVATSGPDPSVGLRFVAIAALKEALRGLEPGFDALGVLIQACPSFFAYSPILRCLQSSSSMPFSGQLIHLTPQPAECPHFADFPPQLREQVGVFDDAQMAAFRGALSSCVGLIQGPPGTGKTRIGVTLAQALLQDPAEVVLCVTFTNHALDQFLEEIMDAGVSSIARIGGRSKSEKLATKNVFAEREYGKRAALDDVARRALFVNRTRAEELEDSIAAFSALVREAPGFKDVMAHLEEADFDAWVALSVDSVGASEGESGDEVDTDANAQNFVVVGQNNRRVRKDHLWERWRRGQDPSPMFLSRAKQGVWAWDLAQRRAAAVTWHAEIVENWRQELAKLLQRYVELNQQKRLLLLHANMAAVRKARVIGCTTNGAAKYHELLADANYTTVLVEEAAEVLEAHIVTSLTPSCKRLILIGDHKQLRPKIEHYPLQRESGNGHDLNISMFERLIRGGYPHHALMTQHRMRPEISALVRDLMYPDLRDGPRVHGYPAVLGAQQPLAFINHEWEEAQDKNEQGYDVQSASKVNEREAAMVVALLAYFLRQGYAAQRLAVLTPYLGQLMAILALVKRANFDFLLTENDAEELAQLADAEADGADAAGFGGGSGSDVARAVRISTVDNFQGEEADVVIVSMVRNNEHGQIGFLKAEQRINVLLSRARHGLFVLGNLACLRRGSVATGAWAKVLNRMPKLNGFPARCQKHAADTLVPDAESFCALVPNGGCLQPCGHVLPCGHGCGSCCHPDSIAHSACSVVLKEQCPTGHPIDRVCSAPTQPPCRVAHVEQCAGYRGQRHNVIRLCHQGQAPSCQMCRVAKDMEVRRQAIERQRARELERVALEQANAVAALDAETAQLAAARAIQEAQANAAKLLEDAERRKMAAEEAARNERHRIAVDAAHRMRAFEDNFEKRRRREAELMEREVRQAQQRADAAKAAHEEHIRKARKLAEQHIQVLNEEESGVQAATAAANKLAEQLCAMSADAMCAVCYDDCKVQDGVFCEHGVGEAAHFLCNECFAGHVTALCEAPIGEQLQRRGRIVCALQPAAAGGCSAQPFADAVVAQHVPGPVFTTYQDAKQRVLESELMAAAERQYEERLARELAVREGERQRMRNRMHIIDKILTLACPRCGQAFADFDGCCALTCPRCRCGFCAYCLKDCGADAHNHVGRCDLGTGLYPQDGAWTQFRTRKLRTFLDGLQLEARTHAIEDCTREISDVGMDVAALRR